MLEKYDIVVIGGGHAGVEASIAAAKMGCHVALVTMDIQSIARMSCNPSIGGTAKGHLVHEIDALGGVMGQLADQTGIQFRILNRSKGPAVWSSRCQSDQDLYSQVAKKLVQTQKNLMLIQGNVTKILAKNHIVYGVELDSSQEIQTKAIIITTGTFLHGKMFMGNKTWQGGRIDEPASLGLSDSLQELGIQIGRLKTGTPPRITVESIHFENTQPQCGDKDFTPFSIHTDISTFPQLPQIQCYLTYTNTTTHEILRKGFDESPLFNGTIQGLGPRYCPSIETKLVRFADKDRHQIFLEPEGLNTNLVYVNGFSTSLPEYIQQDAIHSIVGLEDAQIVRPGYAIEYDFFPAHQLDLTLESKKIKGLYFAGQVNGTSGYEEAAAQGLLAGINAATKIQQKQEIILRRDQAYIGILIDDIINTITLEPYRMFTSRAEYRLLLRQDNAHLRLSPIAYNIGLLDKETYEKIQYQEQQIQQHKQTLPKIRIGGAKLNEYLEQQNTTPIESNESIEILTKRPQISLAPLLQFIDPAVYPTLDTLLQTPKAIEQIEIEWKYQGYIQRQKDMIQKFLRLEEYRIPASLNYEKIHGLSQEGFEKLVQVKPRTLGQASRISGVTPADITVLMIYLK
ncbi:MAG TPA: tRNA uridine-5-carboxymethylaminomethyl(34) synthesis enzyme MnmG [Planctomycetota bacterium]|nr:tRNA uridine-5-carboxymethylaminomethyl(34) synthesis enzyme MnmG [Planctomycetota bacterium]HQA99625.1 tRNA uridine-5-carboxymethylaminomethyl(34) synthesis enzyme MnmG [Planctomycetota bacterium]